jgi:endonuclease YncB( thermonuclease family)
MSRRTRAAGAAPLVLALLAGLLALLGAVGIASPAAAVDKDCGDFDTQKQAQDFYLANDPANDPHQLDGSDNDGIVCESLPCPCSTSTSPTGGTTTKVVRQAGRIVKVVDGDTVDVRLRNGTVKRVRLIGINTPERGRCGFTPATNRMKRMAPRGTRVTLVSDPSQDMRDRYGRLLRYVVRRHDTRDLNRAQVAQGMAKVYVYDRTPFRRVTTYRRAQRAAKDNNRGLWRSCW